jgi:hypothetical protein
MVAVLAATRDRTHDDLVARPNVLGTALGWKRTAGRRTKVPSVVVYVQEKLPSEALSGDDRVPRELGDEVVATDVVALGELQYQFGSGPWFCRDRPDNQGTVTALARTADRRQAAALTCAHCLGGEDANPATPGQVTLWNSDRAQWLPVGSTGPFVNNRGLGLPNAFGFSDWGLFSLEAPELARTAIRGVTLQTVLPRLRTMVFAQSAHGPIHGGVEQVLVRLPGLFADAAILLTSGATFPGDSGLLWRDGRGRGVGIHAIGQNRPTGSLLSFVMFADRIAADLQASAVELIHPV